jgi:hypothetical protein
VKVGDLVVDIRHSPEYVPRPGVIVSITGSIAWVQFPGGMMQRIWVPVEALEVISESG